MAKTKVGLLVSAIIMVSGWCSWGAVGTATAAAAKRHTVIIQGYKFKPAHLVVNTGDTVIWINRDADQHTVTNDRRGPTVLRSRPLASGTNFRVTFVRAGTFRYHCEFHPFMMGSVQVRPHATS